MAKRGERADKSVVPVQGIATSILFIRGQKVMLDAHLATPYSVETKVLKQTVKRKSVVVLTTSCSS